MILGDVRVRQWWKQKSRKFKPPLQAESPSVEAFSMEIADIMMSKINLTENIPPPPQ